MKKTYKVITVFGFDKVWIEHFHSRACANKIFSRNIHEDCDACYLLETETLYVMEGDSVNKILKMYKR